MRLAEFSVKNSLLVNLISAFIILFGFIAMMNIRREAFPSVSFDEMIITTVYPGAPAEDVEKLVTNPLEEEVKGVSGIKELLSRSEEGISTINVVIEPSVSDKKKVVDDVKRAVDRVNNLPEEIDEDPEVIELSSDEFPVFEITLGGNFSEQELRDQAEQLEDRILDIRGVSSMTRYGWRDPEFWVEVDPQKLKDLHVSIDEVMRALAARNVTLPGGLIRTEEFEYSIRTTGEFERADQIADVIIRANDAGNWLRVRDVARVRRAFEQPFDLSRVNGKTTLTMVVVKAASADIIRLVDRVKKEIAVFEKVMLEGMEINVTNDYSYYVQRRLNVLKNNGVIGLLLVVLVLFLFLDPVPAFMTALGLPIALFSTFGIMHLFGISVNLVSMLGLIIVLGMLVDDGIIVSENVYRYVEEGMPPRQAAIRGAQEVIAPVTATILTTFAAFGPLLFMKDILGKFIREVPLAVMIALGASLLEAFIILPAHLADFIHMHHNHRKRRKKRKEPNRWFLKLQQRYTAMLEAILQHRYLFLFGFFLFAVAVVWGCSSTMKYVGFKDDGIEEFYIKAELPEGTSLDKTSVVVEELERVVAALPLSDLKAYRTFIGAIQEDRAFDPGAKKASNLATITVYLTPSQGRTRTVVDIANEIRKKVEGLPGFDRIAVDLPQAGPPTGKAIEVGIKGEGFDHLNQIAGRVMTFLKTVPGVSDLSTSYQPGKKQMMVVVDEDRARQYGVDVHRVAAAVRYAFDGGLATTVKPKEADEEIDVLVRFDEALRHDRKAFEKILVENDHGNLVPLMSVARVDETTGLYGIQHSEGKRVVYVSGNVDRKQATSLSVNTLLQKNSDRFLTDDDFGYSISYGGDFEGQMESLHNLQMSFGVAFFIIFIILTAMFNSMVQPLIVMLAIPFGLIGVMIGFFLHGEPLSFFSLMGLVGLTGIVVNDSVVLVDFINKLRRDGHDRRESLVTAGKLRLRPVLMTTITTIGGLVSVAYGLGGSDPFLKPMGLAIVWGLLFSTILTLMFIPCVYAIVDDITQFILHRSTVKEQED